MQEFRIRWGVLFDLFVLLSLDQRFSNNNFNLDPIYPRLIHETVPLSMNVCWMFSPLFLGWFPTWRRLPIHSSEPLRQTFGTPIQAVDVTYCNHITLCTFYSKLLAWVIFFFFFDHFFFSDYFIPNHPLCFVVLNLALFHPFFFLLVQGVKSADQWLACLLYTSIFSSAIIDLSFLCIDAQLVKKKHFYLQSPVVCLFHCQSVIHLISNTNFFPLC